MFRTFITLLLIYLAQLAPVTSAEVVSAAENDAASAADNEASRQTITQIVSAADNQAATATDNQAATATDNQAATVTDNNGAKLYMDENLFAEMQRDLAEHLSTMQLTGDSELKDKVLREEEKAETHSAHAEDEEEEEDEEDEEEEKNEEEDEEEKEEEEADEEAQVLESKGGQEDLDGGGQGLSDKEELSDAFVASDFNTLMKAYDVNGDTTISWDEFSHLLSHHKVKGQDKQIKRFFHSAFREADADKDNMLTKAEFVKLWDISDRRIEDEEEEDQNESGPKSDIVMR